MSDTGKGVVGVHHVRDMRYEILERPWPPPLVMLAMSYCGITMNSDEHYWITPELLANWGEIKLCPECKANPDFALVMLGLVLGDEE